LLRGLPAGKNKPLALLKSFAEVVKRIDGRYVASSMDIHDSYI